MNLRFYILFIAFILGVPVLLALGVPFLADSNITATVHGATYAWDTLEPLNDTVIDINSNPPQSIVAKNSMYSFDLGPGDYTITASYYRNNTLVYSKQTTLKIEDEGNYVFDLLLYPVSETRKVEAIGEKTNNINSVNPTEEAKTRSSTISYFPVALVLLLLGGGYKLSRKHKETKRNGSQIGKFDASGLFSGLLAKSSGRSPDYDMNSELENIGEATSIKESVLEHVDNSEIETNILKNSPLSKDQHEVLDVIRGHKGRITQKDLRSRLDYSEVKVSLLLSELEKRGLIKKLKSGRENILTLTDEELKER